MSAVPEEELGLVGATVRICSLQDTCPQYSAGHKRKSHHVRITVPCVKMDDPCEMYVQVRNFFGDPIACSLEKVRKMREEDDKGHSSD